MVKKINTMKKYKKQTFWAKCLCGNNIAYFVVIVVSIILIMLMLGMFKRISHVKEQLESCRSSRSAN
jgi:hypothetical protein